MTERELYLRAAKIIRKRGLSIGGRGLTCDGPLCMGQAISESLPEHTRLVLRDPVMLIPRLYEIIGNRSIGAFSDSLPHKRDVIAALLIAADLAA